MRSIRSILFIIFLSLFLGRQIITAQDRHAIILENFLERRSQFSSLSYDIVVKNKLFSKEDTFTREAYVKLIRSSSDSLFGGFFSIDVKDTLWFGYNGKSVMRAAMHDSLLTIVDACKYPGFYVKSTWVDNFIDYGFLRNSQGPRIYIDDPSIEKVYSDTIVEGWPCLGFLFKLPDDEDFSNIRFFVAIDTIDFMVRSRVYSVSFQENEQYTSWHYNQIDYGNESTLAELSEQYMSTFKRIKQYDPDTTSKQSQNDYDYSQLTGKIYNTDEIIELSEVDANLIVLDFWYTSCYPCIKGIPAVNKLYRNYKDKGVAVYGVNMIDDETKSKARLDKFFKNNRMEYPSLMVEPEMASQINISSYPSLLVLDKNFQIIHMEDGFNEDLYEKVAAILDAQH